MKLGSPRATLSTVATSRLLEASIAEATKLGILVHVAVMDSAAVLVGFMSCEGAPRLAATTARHKAFTAVNTAMSTRQWADYVDSIPASERNIIDKVEGYIAADGGYPVVEEGLLLGAIGVSGARRIRE